MGFAGAASNGMEKKCVSRRAVRATTRRKVVILRKRARPWKLAVIGRSDPANQSKSPMHPFRALAGFIAALLLLLPALSLAQGSRPPSKPDFTWTEAGPGLYADKVRFANGDLAQVAQGPIAGHALRGACDLTRLELRGGKSGALLATPLACDDNVSVVAVHPSLERARVAIVTTNCGGTACHAYNDYFVVYLSKGSLRVARVGTGFYGPRGKPMVFSFWFEGDDLVRSTLAPFYGGERNALGDLLPSARQWVAPGEYVDTRFRKSLLPFLGEHPEALLADTEARAPIVNRVKPEQFRAFRAAMSGPGDATLVNGRYLVMNACMKSNCPYAFGAVVADGLTGDLHVMTFNPEEKRHVHVGTRPLNPATDYAWLEAVDTQDVLRLSIEAGKLKVQRVSGK